MFWAKLETSTVLNGSPGTLYGDAQSQQLYVYLSRTEEGFSLNAKLGGKTGGLPAVEIPVPSEDSADGHHIAITTDNAADGAFVNVYYDGDLVLNVTDHAGVVNMTKDDCVAVGTNIRCTPLPTFTGSNFHGSIDNFALYKRELQGDEIAAIFNQPLSLSEVAADETLSIFFDFEDAYEDKSFATNLGSSGSIFDLLLGATHLGSYTVGPAAGTADEKDGDKVREELLSLPPPLCPSHPTTPTAFYRSLRCAGSPRANPWSTARGPTAPWSGPLSHPSTISRRRPS
jgi:hypothetical protein